VIDKTQFRPIGQIDFCDVTHHPDNLFDPLCYQVGSARRVTLAHDYTGSQPRSNSFQALAQWMDDNGIRLIQIEQNLGHGNYRAIIGIRQ